MALTQKEKVAKAKEILEYDFENDKLLWEALSAPGAWGVKPEGNQGLASIGPPIMQTVMKTRSYLKMESIAAANDQANTALSNAALFAVYKSSELEACLNPNPSQVQTSQKTAVSIVNALVGLVSLQEEGNTVRVGQVMQNLGIIGALEDGGDNNDDDDDDARPVKTE